MRLSVLATHIPADRISTEDIVAAADGSVAEARVFRRMFGVDHVAAMPEDQTLSDQFERIVIGLEAEHDGTLPDALIYVRGQPVQYPRGQSPVARLAQEHPFLRGVMRQYEVDQHNCGGLFWALDLARTLLASGLARAVAILGGDCHAGLPLGDRYVPGCTLMGDAFCGMVVDLEAQGDQVAPVTLRTHPEFARGRSGTAAEMGAFFAAHTRIVSEALCDAGFDWAGKDTLLPHNVNRLAWQDFCRQSGIETDRIRLSLLPDIGHCYICDPFLLLAQERLQGPTAHAQPTLISVGMGGYVGACKVTCAAAPTPLSRSHITQKESAPCTQLAPC
ncbi:hypothetical protein [Thalassococcus sp. S3]|uniref:hypothetical protein n=1 Tax=Thalassococcus sp. S3 TaxID=2017482 RepID=UPI00102C53D8|nr:hypothetical protein [Thalassococcus sp. S3]